MEFHILGPLEVLDGGRPVPLRRGRLRVVLAALLLQRNQVVSVDRLVDDLWGDRPPANAANALQVYVSRLRRALAPNGRELIRTQGAGYLLLVDDGAVDLDRFERLADAGRQALLRGNADRASTSLREALALWRGPPLTDLPSEEFARQALGRLEESRLAALEDRIEADLACGRHAVLVGELETLTAEHPYRERFRSQLVLALYRSERQAEALELCRETRRTFVDELGIEPGRHLQELERAILAQDPALTAPTERAPSMRAPQAAPSANGGPDAEAPGQGERRIITAVAADVLDLTTVGASLGAERSKFLFDEVGKLLTAEVVRFGGTLVRSTVDGLSALFGAPVAREDDAERAVRAALGMQRAMSHYAAEVAEAYSVELELRIGVNTGPVSLRPELHRDKRYDALGETVDRASHLQRNAAPGEIVVGPLTARHVRSRFALEPTLAFDVCRVTGERGDVHRAATPLVGRGVELAVLEDALLGVSDNRGAIVAITGEPGIGKSRLAAEALSGWRDSVRVLEAHAASYNQDIPYYPLRELLRAFAGLTLDDPEARTRLELKARLAEALAGRTADEYYPFLASLLGVPLEPDAETRLRELTPDSVQRQTHEAVIDLLRVLARELPLCLLFEDLHFADEPTLDLCAELLTLTEEAPVVVLLVYRADPDLPAWSLSEHARRHHRHRFRELELEPLAPEESRTLAALVAGGDVPRDLADVLNERTGGNPLFVEEAVLDLLERGVLLRSDGGLELTEQELEVPEAVQEALQARLGRLTPGTRDVASAAAVVGRTFGLPILERVVPRDRITPALTELQRLELVVEDRRRAAAEYRFRHGLIQDAAYARLLDVRRRELHRTVGEALEELSSGSPEQAYGELARHFAEADDSRRAVQYLLAAGDAARVVFANEEAIAHYRRALGFLDELGDHARARDTLFKMALAHHLAFDFEQAGKAYEEAFALPAPEVEPLERTEAIEVPGALLRDVVPGRSHFTGEARVTDCLFRGLLRLEPGMNVVPELAESLSLSADGRTYRFRLRGDAYWSDGEPVTAADFTLAWQRNISERAAALPVIGDLHDSRALDDRTLEVRLREPRSFFPYLLAMSWLYPWPRHKVVELGDDWSSPANLVGNGPFVLGALDDDHAVLTANPRWPNGRSNVHTIRIAFPSRDRSFDEGWRAGRYDALISRDPRSLAESDAESFSGLSSTYIGFNSRVEPFDDVRVRTAFARWLDQERVAQCASDLNQPALGGGIIPPGLPGHSHRVAPELDRASARALLAEAGYPDGHGLPELDLIYPAGAHHPGYAQRADECAEQWIALGVRVRPRSVPWADFPAAVADGAHVLHDAWIADYPDPDGFLRTLIETRHELYRDPEIDGLVDRARSVKDQVRRLRLYREVERIWIGERAALIPISYSRKVLLVRPWVEGLRANAFPIGEFDEVIVRPELRRS